MYIEELRNVIKAMSGYIAGPCRLLAKFLFGYLQKYGRERRSEVLYIQ
jgi:hypothetical protein